jgi:integrase
MSLKRAREMAFEYEQMIADGKDPIDERNKARTTARTKKKRFADVLEDWYNAFRKNSDQLSESTRKEDARRVKQLIELFGRRVYIADMTAGLVQEKLLTVATDHGHRSKARALRGMLRELFCYAVPQGLISTNPAAVDFFKLPVLQTTSFPALVAPNEVGQLMRDVREANNLSVLTRAALEMMARTVPRPNNVARMEWSWVRNDAIVIPVASMKIKKNGDGKTRSDHRIPMAKQVRELLDRLRTMTGGRKYVFSLNSRPMGEKTLVRAINALGYGGKHCPHGWRSSFSTLMNAERWPSDLIELALAHSCENKVAATYNRAQNLERLLAAGNGQADAIVDRLWELRCKLMQRWSDRLDALSGANVIAIDKAA